MGKRCTADVLPGGLVRESGKGRVRAQGKSRSGWAGWLQPDPAGEHWSVSSISEPETPAPVSHWLRAAFPTSAGVGKVVLVA